MPDRHEIAALISGMAFRPIDPDRSLNLHYGLCGDEIASILDRVCDHYGKDRDEFWRIVPFALYFDDEPNGCMLPLILVVALLRAVGLYALLAFCLSRAGIVRVEREPQREFTVDHLVEALATCGDARRSDHLSL